MIEDTRPEKKWVWSGVVTGYRTIAEHALGKRLPYGAVVHHLNGNHRDNRNDNLVICPDEAYHNLLHLRLEAYNAVWKCKLRQVLRL